MNLAQHQHEVNRRADLDAYDEKLTERAIDDLVDLMERGDEYPARHNGMNQINRRDILGCQSVDTLADLLNNELTEGPCAIDGAIRTLLRAYFEQHTQWVTLRAEELREEDRQAHEDGELDRRLAAKEKA